MRKILFLIIVLSALIISVDAQEDNLTNFDETVSLIPPQAPEEVTGTNLVNLNIFDYYSKQRITDIHVNIKYTNLDTKQSYETLKYIDKSGVFFERVTDGRYNIILKVDKIDTNGKDFFIDYNLNVDSDKNENIYLLPVGSVRGTVYDSNNNRVNGANIKFDCSGNYGELGNKKTDSFGSFASNWLPVGSCKISSEYNGNVGVTDVEIKQGDLSDVNIELKDKMQNNFILYFIGIICLIILVSLLIYFNFKKIKKQPMPNQHHEQHAAISRRSEDIIKTLDPKEKSVVEFLLKNNNHSSQAKISFCVQIAKTSLVRVLERLLHKKIIAVDKIGKMKKIELTAWFLGKE